MYARVVSLCSVAMVTLSVKQTAGGKIGKGEIKAVVQFEFTNRFGGNSWRSFKRLQETQEERSNMKRCRPQTTQYPLKCL